MMDEENDDDSSSACSITRASIISLLDELINQIVSIRKTLLTVFVSAIFLAPISIGLSIYILTHPAFGKTIDAQDNFGEVLEVLLVAIFIVSSIWLVTGIKQFRSLRSWDKKYEQYLRDQKEIDREITLDHGLSNEGERVVTSTHCNNLNSIRVRVCRYILLSPFLFFSETSFFIRFKYFGRKLNPFWGGFCR